MNARWVFYYGKPNGVKLIIKTMTIKKFDYSKSSEDIFYKVIYPIYAKQFLFGDSLQNFIFLVEANFILNQYQWDMIVKHWEEKEQILRVENC